MTGACPDFIGLWGCGAAVEGERVHSQQTNLASAEAVVAIMTVSGALRSSSRRLIASAGRRGFSYRVGPGITTMALPKLVRSMLSNQIFPDFEHIRSHT
eukprot:scaffold478555_cov22-Prasinocladus_malaysianus.AAC.1